MEYSDRVRFTQSDLTPYTAAESTIFGYNAGAQIDGSRNTLLGFQVCDSSLEGDDNVAIGWDACRFSSGNKNVVVGNAGAPSLAGERNVVIGYGACAALVGASNNTCVGAGCAAAGTTGDDNTVVGCSNVFLGRSCIVLGARNHAVCDGSIVIGGGLVVPTSNAIVVGDAAHTSLRLGGLLYGTAATGLRMPVDLAVGGNVVVDGGLIVGRDATAPPQSYNAYPFSDTAIAAQFSGAVRAPAVALSNWQVMTEANPDTRGHDLVFRSAYNRIVFDDTFEPGVLNFTGQHRCAHPSFSPDDAHLGKIVRSSGRYLNLDGAAAPSLDESVPVVELTTTRADPAVFGVVSGFRRGDFKLGNLRFEVPELRCDVRAVINSVGEGGIWVCDENGPFRNGDLVVSAGRLPGYGCRQDDDIVRSCTVAKITCDCDFGDGMRTAFVGCVYKC
jgi:hypothetical protein